ncbi:RelB antitoxin [Secundilactobacillus silagincola]|uniref:RelB antitoxin n=1 Tax=Secundilactobacillus silagincola TaxID=1714681 RepID=A0A1Z5J1U4_9LACO|nr:type II toxin-antitoxin system RelB/DinJ family antitoxin [Secundilactobacillus silagincola]GAX07987.1 RelB antitoxin [Secundilactobacillus silagincola]
MFKPKNKNVQLNVRVNQKTKEEAQKIYAALGLNLSTEVNMFLAQTVIDKSSLIPDNIDEARNDVLHNHNLTQFNSVKELEDYISKD